MQKMDLGLVFSTSGPYAALGQAARAGAEMAIADLEAEGVARITPMHRDPGGCQQNYETMTAEILRAGVAHVVGAITSWSRKDMIPVLERHGGLLWYPCPYEGFESNDHVVYMGAAPNHHMIPLLDRILRQGVQRAYLVGSNYVWGWETLRLARERLVAAGVEIVGERFLPLGDTDCNRAVTEIASVRPEIVMNSLIGPSNVAFLRGLPTQDRPKILSCNQTEADLDSLGDAGEGLISAGSFFEALGPDAFVARAAQSAPNGRCSGFLATTYASVRLLADSVRRAGTTSPRAVFEAACARPHDTVLGPVAVDPVTRHAALTPHIAALRSGRFEILASASAPIPADPYLINLPPVAMRTAEPSTLRIVQ
ncbi:transporter substrate-binding protein [Citreimonas sp.]|uniref:transporter substrate-binding protein n=1 Tax=Citreimonas sp. TaxID=3036715 RepID=UPI004059BD29